MGLLRDSGAGSPAHRSFIRDEFRFIQMERGALGHDRCVCLLLGDYVRSVGAAGLNARDMLCRLGTHQSRGLGDFGGIIMKLKRHIP